LAIRVFELARSIGVTSKVVLEKCRAEGLEIKNHMSTLSAGQEATVREWFSETGGGTAVETAEHVDLEKARKEAQKTRRRKAKKAKEQAAEQAKKAEAEGEGEPKPADQQPEQEKAPAEPAPAVAVADQAGPAPQAEVETETPVADEAARGEPEPAKPEPTKKKKERKEPKPKDIKPAGPQVVPKPAVLKGPRVVRVEKPDIVRPPRPRRGGAAGPANLANLEISKISGPPTGRAAGDESDEAKKKKSKRRSPRRRGGRAADAGERVQEWRNQDLLERSERLAAAGGGLRRHRPSVTGRRAPAGPHIRTGKVEITEPITVKELSAATGIKVAEIIKKLMGMGIMATVNNVIGRDTAEVLMTEYDIELVVKAAKSPLEELIEKLDARPKGKLVPRAPVVTFLGHVDHGKTSLMDRIRNTGVAQQEAGGITQHIGAYRLEREGSSDVVFLDTPGHEAFTAMRARGANMTDVVVLVVAADDGVMPQTVEAISHAKAAEVPIVVALNKIDLPNANVQRALGQLAEHGLQPREWGGEVEVVQTSAETGEGIDSLVEILSLEAELLELKAENDAPASGYVIEAEMDPGFGVLAKLLVMNGTLKVGDILLAGKSYGHVRSMRDHRGRNAEQVGPATPVQVAGLDELPEAGDKFYVVEDLDQARAVAEQLRTEARANQLAVAPKLGLESLLSQIEAGESHELAIIVKADVQGSVEALVGSLQRLGTDEAKVKILHAGVGGISTGDVTLAEASGALIIGFNVVADTMTSQLAKEKGVEIRLYRVIYEVIEDIRAALEEGLAPEIREESLGRAEVRQVFKISRLGTVAGCLATEGVLQRNAMVRIIRNQVVVEDERSLESLKRFKDDVREVRAGMECGVKIAGYDDIKEGDILEFYRRVEVSRTLQGTAK